MKFKKSFSNIVWLTGAAWLACAVTAKAETELDSVRAGKTFGKLLREEYRAHVPPVKQ